MCNQSDLSDAFSNACKNYNVVFAKAEFRPNCEISIVVGRRKDGGISFYVADYFSFAPKEVIDDLAESCVKYYFSADKEKFVRNIMVHLGDVCKEFMEEGGLIQARPTYVRRNNLIVGNGTYKNLNSSIARLALKGLIDIDVGIQFCWGTLKTNSVKHIGALKIVTLNKTLDTESVPDYVIDYLIHCEVCKLRLGVDWRIKSADYQNMVNLIGSYNVYRAEYWIKNKSDIKIPYLITV